MKTPIDLASEAIAAAHPAILENISAAEVRAEVEQLIARLVLTARNRVVEDVP